jgi:site-specific DNA-methyltransferase (cytosine-N4-specific)
MSEVKSESVDLIITSPPYFNIKDYSKDGKQKEHHSTQKNNDVGALNNYNDYINELLKVWKECYRVLKPNGKLCINVPLMPMLKKDMNTHYNRHIFDLQTDIQHSIISKTKLFLMDLYIWNRTNPSKRLMFGSYPYPRNFYAQNTIEFITIYVKDGKTKDKIKPINKENSKLTQKEWIEYTKQVWNIPVPNKGDLGFGKHSALMPEEIVHRLVRLYSFEQDIVLDPFTGSGTTLKVAKELNRNYIGYELYENYSDVINAKLGSVNDEN